MVALAVVLTVIVVLLSILVAGLLRSHADILKALHDLGSGVGDPATDGRGHRSQAAVGTPPPGAARLLTIGPPGAGTRASTGAPAVVGVTPGGDGLAVSPAQGSGLTLLAFLSAGCAVCDHFWRAFGSPAAGDRLAGARLVVVTRGPDKESPAEIGAKAEGVTEVVMSSEAWADYEVPGAPFFVLVDGTAGRRVGEGLANRLEQLTDLIRVASADDVAGRRRRTRPFSGPGGPERERDVDRALLAAGIRPGDPSLYPRAAGDLLRREGGATAAGRD